MKALFYMSRLFIKMPYKYRLLLFLSAIGTIILFNFSVVQATTTGVGQVISNIQAKDLFVGIFKEYNTKKDAKERISRQSIKLIRDHNEELGPLPPNASTHCQLLYGLKKVEYSIWITENKTITTLRTDKDQACLARCAADANTCGGICDADAETCNAGCSENHDEANGGGGGAECAGNCASEKADCDADCAKGKAKCDATCGDVYDGLIETAEEQKKKMETSKQDIIDMLNELRDSDSEEFDYNAQCVGGGDGLSTGDGTNSDSQNCPTESTMPEQCEKVKKPDLKQCSRLICGTQINSCDCKWYCSQQTDDHAYCNSVAECRKNTTLSNCKKICDHVYNHFCVEEVGKCKSDPLSESCENYCRHYPRLELCQWRTACKTQGPPSEGCKKMCKANSNSFCEAHRDCQNNPSPVTCGPFCRQAQMQEVSFCRQIEACRTDPSACPSSGGNPSSGGPNADSNRNTPGGGGTNTDSIPNPTPSKNRGEPNPPPGTSSFTGNSFVPYYGVDPRRDTSSLDSITATDKEFGPNFLHKLGTNANLTPQEQAGINNMLTGDTLGGSGAGLGSSGLSGLPGTGLPGSGTKGKSGSGNGDKNAVSPGTEGMGGFSGMAGSDLAGGGGPAGGSGRGGLSPFRRGLGSANNFKNRFKNRGKESPLANKSVSIGNDLVGVGADNIFFMVHRVNRKLDEDEKRFIEDF